MAVDFSNVSAAVDFSGVVVAILGIGAVIAAVHGIQWCVKRVLALIGGNDYDYEGFGDSEHGSGAMDAVYARAAAMAAAGEGQSEDFRHNTVTAAYDAGYYGKRLGDSVDPATLAAHQQGVADRAGDRSKGMK